MEFSISSIYPFLSMEPISALVASSRLLFLKSMAPITVSASLFSASTSMTLSFLLTFINKLGFISNDIMESTALALYIPLPPNPTISRSSAATARLKALIQLFFLIFFSLICITFPFCSSQLERMESRTSGTLCSTAVLILLLISFSFILFSLR